MPINPVSSCACGTVPEASIEASPDRLRVDLDDVHLELRITEPYAWPKAFGGGGVLSAVPFLNQYWHPYRLGGVATGVIGFGGDRGSLDGATVYGERNWGAGFPERWWWGQAHDFDGADVSVAVLGWSAAPRADRSGGGRRGRAAR